MLGQLQDAGNTTTLVHYLDLLSAAGMLTGLQKFSGARVRQRGSSPKLLVLNTALMSATSAEVKSGRRRDSLPEMAVFTEAHDVDRQLLVGGDGIRLEEFPLAPSARWLSGSVPPQDARGRRRSPPSRATRDERPLRRVW